jgi:hypothetical protein
MAGERVLPGLGLRGFYTIGSDGWETTVSEDLLKISVTAQITVISRTTVLPGSPTDGDMYIVIVGAALNEEELAVRENGAWVYYVADPGWTAWVIDDAEFVSFDGTNWVAGGGASLPRPYDLGLFAAGVLTNDETVFKLVVGRVFKMLADFTDSTANLLVAPSGGSVIFSLKKGGVEFGTITFLDAATAGTYAATTGGVDTAFALADVITVVAPADTRSAEGLSAHIIGKVET